MNKHITQIVLGFILLLNASWIQASNNPIIYKINIKKEINHTTFIYLNNGLKEAKELNAEAILIDLNTYGGLVETADSMRTAILYSSIPVYVFIDNNAASAGALLSIACKKIYMRKGANIGAATVVNQTGEAMPDKYQSYMRSIMRSTAEAQGKDTVIQGRDTIITWKRNPMIAEAMVDDRVVISNLIDSGKVLTFTAEEALKWGYCDGIAESDSEVITKYLKYNNYELKSYAPSWLDDLKGFMMNPVIQSLLILIIIGGIYFELQTPGIGFAAIASITAAVLYFAPLYLDGLAQYWEILVFIIGIVLVIFEIFVIPGFGIAGISGIICIVGGLVVSLLNNDDLNFDNITGGEFGQATFTVLIGLTLGFSLTIWLSSKIGNKGLFRKIALDTDLQESTSSPSLSTLIGKIGIATTVLKPSGKVLIEGEIYDAISESVFIEKGTQIVVTRFENAQIYVKIIRL